MSNWDRRDALVLVEAIENCLRGVSMEATEKQALSLVAHEAKKASVTCETDARRILAIRQQLCKVCVSGRIHGCGPINAGSSQCFWLAGEVPAQASASGFPH